MIRGCQFEDFGTKCKLGTNAPVVLQQTSGVQNFCNSGNEKKDKMLKINWTISILVFHLSKIRLIKLSQKLKFIFSRPNSSCILLMSFILKISSTVTEVVGIGRYDLLISKNHPFIQR